MLTKAIEIGAANFSIEPIITGCGSNICSSSASPAPKPTTLTSLPFHGFSSLSHTHGGITPHRDAAGDRTGRRVRREKSRHDGFERVHVVLMVRLDVLKYLDIRVLAARQA